jgi:hypothetical protein
MTVRIRKRVGFRSSNYSKIDVFFCLGPRISEPLLNLLKNIMTKASSEALKIYGYDKSEWQPVLQNAIYSDQLAVEFGGTKVR